jgi:hypothetical protein
MAAGLCQAFISTGNSIASVNEPGNNFVFTIPGVSLRVGDYMLLSLTYQNGSTVTSISDTVNGAWSTTAQVTAANSGGNNTGFYRFANSGAGASATLTIAFSGNQQPVIWRLMVFSGLATASVENGTAQAAGVQGTALATGAFTPGNNNANGGNLIVSVFDFADGAAGSANPSGFSPSAGFTLMDADIGWNTGQGLPKAAATFVQATSASINPGMTATGDATNHYNCIAIALKLAPGGTDPPAFRVAKFIEQFNSSQSAATWVLQFPTIGNLRILETTQPQNSVNYTSVTDSEGNNWINVTQSGDTPQMFYWPNAAANPNLVVTVNQTGAGGGQVHAALLDVTGALVSPLGAIGFKDSTGANSVTSVAHQPDITPQSTSSVVIGMLADGLGPVTALTSPTGALFMSVAYTGVTDSNNYSSGDGWGIMYNSSLSAQNWTWSIVSQPSNSVASLAVEFLGTQGAQPQAALRPFGVLGLASSEW